MFDLAPAPEGAWRSIRGDVLDAGAIARACLGQDAVVHLAGIPHPLEEPGAHVFLTNASGTFNTVQGAERAGARRFVFLSSESVLGFAFATHRPPLAALPVDESHPLRPQDPYGLSKLAAEQAVAAATERSGMETVSIRPPWVWVPEERALHRSLLERPDTFAHSLWSYIDVEDLADALLAALVRPLPAPHQTLFAAAPDAGARDDIRGLVARFYPEARSLAAPLSPSAPLISSARLGAVLGVTPSRSWRDVPELVR